MGKLTDSETPTETHVTTWKESRSCAVTESLKSNREAALQLPLLEYSLLLSSLQEDMLISSRQSLTRSAHNCSFKPRFPHQNHPMIITELDDLFEIRKWYSVHKTA